MADLLNCLVPLGFGLADAAAQTSTFTALVPSPAPDASDVDGFIMPKAGAIVAICLMGKPTQTGDFVTVEVFKNGTGIAATALSNAYSASGESGATLILSKETAQFVAGDILQCRYKTTTGGTYGVNDVTVQVIVQLGLSE